MIGNLHVLGVDTDGDNVDNANVLGDDDNEWNSLVQTHRCLVEGHLASILLYLQDRSKPIFDLMFLSTLKDLYKGYNNKY